MTDTGFFVPAEKQARFAANYYRDDGKGTASSSATTLPERLPAQARASVRRRRAGRHGERLHAVPA